jgi:hypothetical protein
MSFADQLADNTEQVRERFREEKSKILETLVEKVKKGCREASDRGMYTFDLDLDEIKYKPEHIEALIERFQGASLNLQVDKTKSWWLGDSSNVLRFSWKRI